MNSTLQNRGACRAEFIRPMPVRLVELSAIDFSRIIVGISLLFDGMSLFMFGVAMKIGRAL